MSCSLFSLLIVSIVPTVTPTVMASNISSNSQIDSMTILGWVFSFIGGGTVSAIINAIRVQVSEKNKGELSI